MQAIDFKRALNATVTITDGHGRNTYKVQAPSIATPRGGKIRDEKASVRFISVLTGENNENDYTFLGMVFLDSDKFITSKKSRISWDAPSARRFWSFTNKRGTFELHHEGKCLRCGRKLTVPSSIESGYGPECINK